MSMKISGQYVKRPIPVQCDQWFRNGDHPDDKCRWIATGNPRDPHEAFLSEGQVVRYFRRPEPEYAGQKTHDRCGKIWHDHGRIDTLEGGHTVCPGDIIITGVQGERYPCKPDIFATTYEVAE